MTAGAAEGGDCPGGGKRVFQEVLGNCFLTLRDQISGSTILKRSTWTAHVTYPPGNTRRHLAELSGNGLMIPRFVRRPVNSVHPG